MLYRVTYNDGTTKDVEAESEREVVLRMGNYLSGTVAPVNPGMSAPNGLRSESDDCPECGHPKDGSSGHGTCDHPCHGAA